ncbi:hypothetical protein F5146DRAFT_315558 [Armillaria mellea]|nr:hypothetical protein F5146DRAFT_315558 [Armillaria mellea]
MISMLSSPSLPTYSSFVSPSNVTRAAVVIGSQKNPTTLLYVQLYDILTSRTQPRSELSHCPQALWKKSPSAFSLLMQKTMTKTTKISSMTSYIVRNIRCRSRRFDWARNSMILQGFSIRHSGSHCAWTSHYIMMLKSACSLFDALAFTEFLPQLQALKVVWIAWEYDGADAEAIATMFLSRHLTFAADGSCRSGTR